MAPTRPSTIASVTKSATESSADANLECVECGHDVVTDLLLVTMGVYQEVLCANPWACWERQCQTPL